MIIVGSTLGKASAGLFRVIKQLGTIPGRVFNPFEYVLFTELSRASAAQDYAGFRSLLRKVVAISGVGSLLIWSIAALAAEPLIDGIAGHEYVDAVPAFRIYLFAMILQVIGMPILRAMIALGRPGTLFVFDSASLIVVAAATAVGGYVWGLEGIAAAIVLHKAIQVAWSATFIWRFLHNAESALANK
jgi:O-antigen/teichoic acid export membrane protein